MMGFSAKQVQALRRKLDCGHIRTREANGRELSYIEGWFSISEANRIFGFDGWSRETVETRCVLARENRGSFLAVYIAKVRITVYADGPTIVREVMDRVRAVASHPVKFTTLLLKRLKRTPPSGPLQHSVSPLALSFTARTRRMPLSIHPRCSLQW
jgi:Rad52/22 family double-strand break repair protein